MLRSWDQLRNGYTNQNKHLCKTANALLFNHRQLKSSFKVSGSCLGDFLVLCFKQVSAARKRTLLTGRRLNVLAPIRVSELCQVRIEAAGGSATGLPLPALLRCLSRPAPPRTPMTPRSTVAPWAGSKRFFPLD